MSQFDEFRNFKWGLLYTALKEDITYLKITVLKRIQTKHNLWVQKNSLLLSV